MPKSLGASLGQQDAEAKPAKFLRSSTNVSAPVPFRKDALGAVYALAGSSRSSPSSVSNARIRAWRPVLFGNSHQ